MATGKRITGETDVIQSLWEGKSEEGPSESLNCGQRLGCDLPGGLSLFSMQHNWRRLDAHFSGVTDAQGGQGHVTEVV